MSNKGHAGRKGTDVRSDCYVEFEPGSTGELEINIRSKVKILYGDQILHLVQEVLETLGIQHGKIELEDFGALPFTLAARIETAVKRAMPGLSKEYWPPLKAAVYTTKTARLRRSRLYLPGNEPKFFVNAGLHGPDGIILDLEDSVAPQEKDAARVLVRNALRSIDFYGAERMVRINQGSMGLKDLEYLVPQNVNLILIPKCEKVEDIQRVDEEITLLKQKFDVSHDIWLMPIIESALGVMKAYEIATASRNNVALAIGLEDYTADIGTQRTLEGHESFFARGTIINAARAAGLQPIDTVFSDVADMEGLRQSVMESKALGFEGKGCIHPRQIAVINEAFLPTLNEIDKAAKIVLAFEKAKAQGLGVVALGSKMIDPPVVNRALKTIELAEISGKLSADWRKNR